MQVPNGSDGSMLTRNFWQSATELGGATGVAANALTQDFKDTAVFAGVTANNLLVVVHDGNGAALGWRTWQLESATTLQNAFGGSDKNNTCWDTSDNTLTGYTCNTLASQTTGGNVGSLQPEEPLVYNNNDNSGLYTNGGSDNDFNRLSTSCTFPANLGWGLGTLYDANFDGNGMGCKSTTYRPICDAQFHTTHHHWGSGGGIGGMIGTDHTCNGGCPWTMQSGYSYNYAIYVV